MRPEVGALGTILGVWAHPDDETYLTAGIMALAVSNGQRVVCATATRGEKGSQDEVRWPPETIAATRAGELEAALGILGVQEHHWLDYVDGECDGADGAKAADRVAALIRSVRPDTILTFGPDGQTGHPDHLAVHRWTLEAWDACGRSGTLAWAAVPDGWQELAARLNEYDVFGPGTPVFVPADELEIHLDLPPDLLELKLAALRAQPSQTDGLIAALGEEFTRRVLSTESFRRAAA